MSDSWTVPSNPCLDCGQPTWQPDQQSEWYMVHNRIWAASGAPTRAVIIPGQPGYYLCIGCLETRIGRQLTAADFTDAPVNAPRPGNTDRLNERLTGAT